jgi:FkbM family methyltransferase
MGGIGARARGLLRGALQAGLGLDRYLELFARYKVATLRWSGEGRDLAAFLRHVPAEGVVLDVGANVGFTAVPLARHARRGTVHAFEPHPLAFRALRAVVARHGLRNVVAHRLALGSADGPVEMVTPVEGRALLPALSRVAGDAAPGERFVAECRTLDGMEELREGPRVVALKIDVEDHEHHVLVGASRLLAEHRPVLLCELWDTENRRLCLSLLRDLGYAVRVREGGALVPFDPSRHRRLNFYFFPGDETPA